VKRLAIFVGLALLALGLLGVSSAATIPLAGSLDPSFGHGGVATGNAAEVAGIAVQKDGKIVAAGSTSGEELWLARYLPDGSLDPSFGDGGEVVTKIGGWGFASAVALQPDGKIVVAGGSYQGGGDSDHEILEEFTLARYNPNGSLDSSFGTDGITNTVIPESSPGDGCFLTWSADASSLAIVSGGDILVGGGSALGDDCLAKSGGESWLVLARYTPDGTLDPTFGDGGITQTPGGGYGIAVQPDGEIVASEGEGLAGFAPSGAPNVTFDRDPKLGSYDALALQAGKIVVAGTSRPAKHRHWSLEVARYLANGHRDSTFGTHGQTEIKRVTGVLPSAVLAEGDGKLLIAAARRIVRLLPNGRLDPHFGKGGIVSLGHEVLPLGLQGDGKILAGTVIKPGAVGALDRLLGGNNCVVPGLRGKRVTKASAALRESYCRRGHVAKRFSHKVKRGRVISTAPRAGTRLSGGSKVELVVSKGKRP
jgi:uncharacterized delta-60 repeat protein